MAADEKDGLFEGLPERAAPVFGGGGRPRLRKAERGQVELRAVSLDDLVPADHRVRLVWAFTEQLGLGPLDGRSRRLKGVRAIRPPIRGC
jgi:hypothetical protein